MAQIDERPRGVSLALIACLLVIAAILPFIPLALAGIERLFGTQYTEDFCSLIGIHGILSDLYNYVWDAIRWLTR